MRLPPETTPTTSSHSTAIFASHSIDSTSLHPSKKPVYSICIDYIDFHDAAARAELQLSAIVTGLVLATRRSNRQEMIDRAPGIAVTQEYAEVCITAGRIHQPLTRDGLVEGSRRSLRVWPPSLTGVVHFQSHGQNDAHPLTGRFIAQIPELVAFSTLRTPLPYC